MSSGLALSFQEANMKISTSANTRAAKKSSNVHTILEKARTILLGLFNHSQLSKQKSSLPINQAERSFAPLCQRQPIRISGPKNQNDLPKSLIINSNSPKLRIYSPPPETDAEMITNHISEYDWSSDQDHWIDPYFLDLCA